MLTQSETTQTPGILAATATRRKFLKSTGLAAGVAGLAGCGGIIGVDPSTGPARPPPPPRPATQPPTPTS